MLVNSSKNHSAVFAVIYGRTDMGKNAAIGEFFKEFDEAPRMVFRLESAEDHRVCYLSRSKRLRSEIHTERVVDHVSHDVRKGMKAL